MAPRSGCIQPSSLHSCCFHLTSLALAELNVGYRWAWHRLPLCSHIWVFSSALSAWKTLPNHLHIQPSPILQVPDQVSLPPQNSLASLPQGAPWPCLVMVTLTPISSSQSSLRPPARTSSRSDVLLSSPKASSAAPFLEQACK